MNFKKIERILPPVAPNWVGNGFRMHNFFPSGYRINRMMSPFFLMDYNSKIDLNPSDEPRGVGAHPHKGFETVTIVYHGKIAHEDSKGNKGVVGPGGIQWMTAGSGLLHKEFHEETFQKSGGPFQMVQLWVNLPAKFKYVEPSYQDIRHEDKGLFSTNSDTTQVFIIAGEYKGRKGPAKTYSRINIFDIIMKEGSLLDLELDGASNTGMLLVEGKAILNEEEELQQDHFALFKVTDNAEGIRIKALENSRLLLLDGDPINEPIAQYGPFLMNTHEELQTAIQEFNSGKYGVLN
jgi:redox-sensitive bicupin YhaK (pirin superfamily)